MAGSAAKSEPSREAQLSAGGKEALVQRLVGPEKREFDHALLQEQNAVQSLLADVVTPDVEIGIGDVELLAVVVVVARDRILAVGQAIMSARA